MGDKMTTRISEIEARLKSCGEPLPSRAEVILGKCPAVFICNAPSDICFLLEEVKLLREALERIEIDTRNASVVGHPGITCMECGITNELASNALGGSK